jgi:hypothetical protein
MSAGCGVSEKHQFPGGAFGPNFIEALLAAGHSWQKIQDLAKGLADHLFISRNFDALKTRGVDMLFHPGTHDFSACDIPWGGGRYPQIPIFLKPNTGHNKKMHPMEERDERNKTAFLLSHFIDEVDPLLEPPSLEYKKGGKKLLMAVKFPKGSKAESGRIWWMYDRPPDGSSAYLQRMFPNDQWKDMEFDPGKKWLAEIELNADAKYYRLF